MEQDEFFQKLGQNPFLNKNHILVKEVCRDRAVLELTAQEDSLNPLGTVHGGALFTMADSAAGTAARSTGKTYVTMSSNFTYLRSGLLGDVIRAEGRVRRRGQTTCYVDVDVTNGREELLATGNFIFFRVDENKLPKKK